MKNEQSGWNLAQSYTELPEFFYTETLPDLGESAKLVLFNHPLAMELGLNPDVLQKEADIFAGNTEGTGVIPIAQAYAGHQFGGFTKLGDGRAVLIGEQVTPKGERFDIQLKGSGKTSYSRGGDGLASVGPMLREYIISEAVHGLGIPTTRSLAVVTSEEPIYREEELQRGILTRVASSHIRVGTFQYAAALGTKDDLQALADYAIARHDPDILFEPNKYERFLENVLGRQASLIAKWQCVGFIHGVMNTDNVTISGETIDYGPCAFMNTYKENTVFSSIDRQSRYAFGKQPYIGAWNVTRFAESLLPLLAEEEEAAVEIAQNILAKYECVFRKHFESGMRSKLGLFEEEISDSDLINQLLGLLEKYEMDYTNIFVALTFDKLEDMILQGKADFMEWCNTWQNRQASQNQSLEESRTLMREHNPAVIPRNHLVEEALAAAVDDGDFANVKQLVEVLKSPYAHTKEQVTYANVPKDDADYQTFCGT